MTQRYLYLSPGRSWENGGGGGLRRWVKRGYYPVLDVGIWGLLDELGEM